MNKFLIGTVLATLLIIVGAVLVINRANNTSPSPSEAPKVDNLILVHEDSNKITSDGATVTLVEFGDFQCPACASYHPIVKQLIAEFKGKMNFVFRNYPLAQHKNARISAYAAEAAGKQGKYWEMYDKLYETQDDWSESGKAKDIFIGYAKDLGLNEDQFKKDIDSSPVKAKIDGDLKDGNTLLVNSTPTFFLNSQKIASPKSYEDFKTLVNAALINVPIDAGSSERFHAHADMKVYINGIPVNFSLAKYQSDEGAELSPDAHFHDENGEVYHMHKSGTSLDTLFKSIKINLSANSLTMDNGQKYDNNDKSSLKMFVNGKQNIEYANYKPQDLDRILITYGPESQAQIQTQINSVTDKACIYSEKCPERGKPPVENCVGGLGTDCINE